MHEILQFCKFLGFSQNQITHETQNQNMVPDFSVYFDVKSLSLAKINPRKYPNPCIVKILRHKCSKGVKKLICNCWVNHNVNSEFKTFCKKGDAGNNPF